MAKKYFFCLSAVFLFLCLSTGTYALDQTGSFTIGGNVGYSVGFGDVFKDQKFSYEDPVMGTERATVDNKLGFSWGARVRYGLAPNWALEGAYGYQTTDPSVVASTNIGDYWRGGEMKNFQYAAINVLYILSPERKTSAYFTGGAGWYILQDKNNKPGINVGIGAEGLLQSYLGLDLRIGLHMIATEPQITTYLDAQAGLNLRFGR